MTIQRMVHVGVVVELVWNWRARRQSRDVGWTASSGSATSESKIAMMRTPHGHGRLELTKFHTRTAVSAETENAPANTLGIRRIMFAVDDIEDVVARLRTHGAEPVGELE